MGFRTIGTHAEFQEEIKGSRFLGWAARVDARADAEGRLDGLREAYPDASHVCFAYRIGPDRRFSDDGEPGGTAGRPIYEIILRRDLDHVLVAVVRWFGGTRLGTGGLARAYGGTAAKTLDRAGEREVADAVQWMVLVPFAHTDVVLRSLEGDPRVQLGAPSFRARGMCLQVTVASDAAEDIRRLLRDATRGDVEFAACS